MEMKIVGVALAAFVSLVVLAAVLMPILDDATATTDTLTNTGFNRYTSIESTDADTITIGWDHTKPHVLTVNGDDIDLAILTSYTSILFGQDFTFRCIHTATFCDIQLIGPTAAVFLNSSTTNGYDLSVTATAGSLSATVNSVTKTLSYTTLYYLADDGEYIMKDPNATAYVLSDSSLIIANGVTTVAGFGVGVYFTGDIEDGYTFAFYRDTSASASDVVSHYTEDSTHKGVYSLENITFTLTDNGSTADATYSYFLVPYEITAERSVHFTDGMNELLLVIPVLVIVAILLGVIALVIRSKLD